MAAPGRAVYPQPASSSGAASRGVAPAGPGRRLRHVVQVDELPATSVRRSRLP
jgi:hypothetical protein